LKGMRMAAIPLAGTHGEMVDLSTKHGRVVGLCLPRSLC
jgi:hypothetical protein